MPALNLQPKTYQKGFTLIEVLIVLAIAGLIVLLLFLAVPALQRGVRNDQRKRDVSILAAEINECLSNHANDITICEQPANVDPHPDKSFTIYSCFHYGDSSVPNNVCPTSGTLTCGPGGVAGSNQCPPSEDEPNYNFGNACNATGSWFVPSGTAYVKQFVVTYMYEVGSSRADRCIDG